MTALDGDLLYECSVCRDITAHVYTRRFNELKSSQRARCLGCRRFQVIPSNARESSRREGVREQPLELPSVEEVERLRHMSLQVTW